MAKSAYFETKFDEILNHLRLLESQYCPEQLTPKLENQLVRLNVTTVSLMLLEIKLL